MRLSKHGKLPLSLFSSSLKSTCAFFSFSLSYFFLDSRRRRLKTLQMAFTRYGDQSNRQRRIARKAFGSPTIPSYYPFLSTETHDFLRRLVADPTEYVKYVRRYAGGLTLSVVYGYEPVSNDDAFLSLAEECVDLLANRIASGGGIWPVDVFPFLKHIPLWMPGSGFKKNAITWRKKMEEFVDRPFEYVKTSMVSTFNIGNCSRIYLLYIEVCFIQTFFLLNPPRRRKYQRRGPIRIWPQMDSQLNVFSQSRHGTPKFSLLIEHIFIPWCFI